MSLRIALSTTSPGLSHLDQTQASDSQREWQHRPLVSLTDGVDFDFYKVDGGVPDAPAPLPPSPPPPPPEPYVPQQIGVSFGIDVSVSVLAPFLSNGGGTYGVTAGVNTNTGASVDGYNSTPGGDSNGFSVGISVGATGSVGWPTSVSGRRVCTPLKPRRPTFLGATPTHPRPGGSLMAASASKETSTETDIFPMKKYES